MHGLKTTKDYRCYCSYCVSYPIFRNRNRYFGMPCLKIDDSLVVLIPGASHENENSLHGGVMGFGAHVKDVLECLPIS